MEFLRGSLKWRFQSSENRICKIFGHFAWITLIYFQFNIFSSTHFSIYKGTFAFYKDTKCVQGHAILMPELSSINTKGWCRHTCIYSEFHRTFALS